MMFPSSKYTNSYEMITCIVIRWYIAQKVWMCMTSSLKLLLLFRISGRRVWLELCRQQRQNISALLSTWQSPASQSLCFAGAAQASAVQSNSQLLVGRRRVHSSEKNSNLFSCDRSDSPAVKHGQVMWRGQSHCEIKNNNRPVRKELKN